MYSQCRSLWFYSCNVLMVTCVIRVWCLRVSCTRMAESAGQRGYRSFKQRRPLCQYYMNWTVVIATLMLWRFYTSIILSRTTHSAFYVYYFIVFSSLLCGWKSGTQKLLYACLKQHVRYTCVFCLFTCIWNTFGKFSLASHCKNDVSLSVSTRGRICFMLVVIK